MPDPIPDVEERTTSYVDFEFLDKNGAPALPKEITYKIDDETNNVSVRGPTSVSPSPKGIIAIGVAENTIINQVNAKETRRVTVTATYADNDGAEKVTRYSVVKH